MQGIWRISLATQPFVQGHRLQLSAAERRRRHIQLGPSELGIPLLFTEEFEVVIMIEVVTEEMHGSDRNSDLKLSTSEPWSVWLCFQQERNGALS